MPRERISLTNTLNDSGMPACISCDGNLGESAQLVFDRIAKQFRVVDETGDVVLYERTGT